MRVAVWTKSGDEWSQTFGRHRVLKPKLPWEKKNRIEIKGNEWKMPKWRYG
jgi:hypothetical protein